MYAYRTFANVPLNIPQRIHRTFANVPLNIPHSTALTQNVRERSFRTFHSAYIERSRTFLSNIPQRLHRTFLSNIPQHLYRTFFRTFQSAYAIYRTFYSNIPSRAYAQNFRERSIRTFQNAYATYLVRHGYSVQVSDVPGSPQSVSTESLPSEHLRKNLFLGSVSRGISHNFGTLKNSATKFILN